MANYFLQTLIPLLSSIPLLLALAKTPARGGQAEYITFFYDFNGDQPTTLFYQGDAHFPSDSNHLRLTKTDTSGNALKHSVGRAVYTDQIKFWEAGAQMDFDTTITFIINPNSGDNEPADGFTFFIMPVCNPVGSPGGSFGIINTSGQNPSIFAVEFDIYSNPGVDPSYSHVGIDIESNVSKNLTNVGDTFLGQEVTDRISYNDTAKLIFVHVSAGSETFEVSYVYDLATILPQFVQVRISAATGGQVAVHDLTGWDFFYTMVHNTASVLSEVE